LLGPIVPQSNPVLLAEEMAMLDTMADGRLIVGMLRGTSNEMMTYDLNPAESRERTDEGMEPLPHRVGVAETAAAALPPIYALGTSREASDFAARNHIGLGVSFGPFDAMGRVTGYYKEECARHGWQPEPHQIIYRANILIAETDDKAQQVLAQYPAGGGIPAEGRGRRQAAGSRPAQRRRRVSGSWTVQPPRSRARAPTGDVGFHNRTAPPRSKTGALPRPCQACASDDPTPRRVGDPAMFPDLAAQTALGHRDDNAFLVNVQPDIPDTIAHDPSPMHEARHRPIRRNPRYLHTARRVAPPSGGHLV
jgi:Luciferase-like monooxygenase